MKIAFDDLFTGRGSDSLAFSPRAASLSGAAVQIRGYLVPMHAEPDRYVLVDVPGACPDCAPAPVASIHLPGFRVSAGMKVSAAVRLRGRLSYGFAIADDGCASFLRLEDAQVDIGLRLSSPAVPTGCP